MIKINKALGPIRGAFLVLTVALGLSQEAWTSDLPEGGSHSNNTGGYSTHQEKIFPTGQKGGEAPHSQEVVIKKSWIDFKPFYPDRRVTFPIPGGRVSLPIIKGSIWGTLGFGIWAFLPQPLNSVFGFPLAGFGLATHYIPLCKTTLEKVVLGSSITGATAFVTFFACIMSLGEAYSKGKS